MLDLKAIVENAVVAVDENIVHMAKELENVSRMTSREHYIYVLGKALGESIPIIDIEVALRSAGCHPDIAKMWPKLAFCRADQSRCEAVLRDNGSVNFDSQITVPDMVPMPKFIRFWLGGRRWQADVPLVPTKIRPDDLRKYCILWEPVWESVPKVADPYLLKYIIGSYYQVIASWNVTELEISIMRAARI